MTAQAHWLKAEQTVRDRLSEIVACEGPSPDVGSRRVVKHLEACFLLDIIDDLRSDLKTWKDRANQNRVDYINGLAEDLKKARNEIEILRHYGNKDCTALADARLASGETLG